MFWVIGGAAAVVASAYAVKRIQVYLAWQDEKEEEENERKIERYENYMHANGGKQRKPRSARRSQVTS